MADRVTHKVRLSAGKVSMLGELNDSDTANAIRAALPIQAPARAWGQEVYFPIPVTRDEDNAQDAVPSGTLAYWPPGKCFCIFYGQRPASPVNVVGRLLGAPDEWAKVKEGTEVSIEDADTL